MKLSEGLRKGLAIKEKIGRPYCAAVIVAAGTSSRMGGTNKILTVLENLPVICRTVDVFDKCAMIDEINSPWITACLDIGHTALVGVDPADAIRALGHDRLKALHVHDVDYLHDCHTLPFNRNLDWDAITAALAEIHYDGDFTFEADAFLEQFPRELRKDASVLMARTGRYLVEKTGL